MGDPERRGAERSETLREELPGSGVVEGLDLNHRQLWLHAADGGAQLLRDGSARRMVHEQLHPAFRLLFERNVYKRPSALHDAPVLRVPRDADYFEGTSLVFPARGLPDAPPHGRLSRPRDACEGFVDDGHQRPTVRK